MCVLSHVQLFETPLTVGFQPPWDSPGKNTGVGSHFLFQGDLPNPETEPVSPTSPALAGEFFTTAPPGKPHTNLSFFHFFSWLDSSFFQY